MDKYTKRKLNLLIYLARVDGKFHRAEKAILKEFVNEKGFDMEEFRLLKPMAKNSHDLPLADDKKEMLFLAIRLMQADKVIDRKEMEFCKEIASKLGYDAAVVDEYAHHELDRESFDATIDDWLL